MGARSRTRRECALPARLQFAHYFRLSGFRERLRDVLRAVPFGGIGRHGRSAGSIVVIRLIRGTLGLFLFLVLGAVATALQAPTTLPTRMAIEDDPPGEAVRVMDQRPQCPDSRSGSPRA